MAERAVFLDRDNTIIENDGYLGVASQVKLLAGAATALSAIRALGYRLIVVSNQSGVARGMFSEADVEAVNQEMCKQLRDQAGAHIDASYYCPYHPDAVIAEYKLDHDWRKPKPGMFRQAATDFNLDLTQCWAIGDQPRDIAAGAAAGCRTILLRDPDRKPTDADPSGTQVSPNFVVKTLADAARIIAREGKSPPPVPPSAGTASREQGGAAPHSAGAADSASAARPAGTLVSATTEAGAPAAPSVGELADQVAQRLARQIPTSTAAQPGKLERSLDDLLTLLRVQNRNADIRPDFSGLKLAAVLLQVFAALALLAGLWQMFTAGAALFPWEKVVLVMTNLERAAIWVLAAVVLQGAVIALLMFSKER